MSLLHGRSAPFIRSEVDIFSLPATDTTCDYGIYEEYLPSVSISDSTNKLEFNLAGNANHYYSVDDNFLKLSLAKILKTLSP